MKEKHIAKELKNECHDWYEHEFSTANLGDKRLNKRLVKIAGDLSSNPSMPINQASGDWHSTKAAYQFFDNVKVSPESILAPHYTNTAWRMKYHSVVLAVQDTTSFNYTSHKSLDLGPIGKDNKSGIFQHNTLAVSSDGLPLGLLDQITWTRDRNSVQEAKKEHLDIAERESFKWIQSLLNTVKHSSEETKIVTVCDREADIYEFFDEAEKLNASILVRCKHNRNIDESHLGLKDYLKRQKIQCQYEVVVPRRKGDYPDRTATVTLTYAPITIQVPEHLETEVQHDEIKMAAIHVKEISAPSGIEPIEWYLLTNIPIASVDEALEKVDWYLKRWLVEVYHKSEKSCCSSEECRLETKERIFNFLAVNSVIGWRVMFITYIARQNPKGSTDAILAPVEVNVLQGVINQKLNKSMKIKNIRDAVHAIAMLGGYMGRKSDKAPGIITVCRGMMRLHDFLRGYLWASDVDDSNTYG